MGRRKGSIDMLSGLPDEILHHILSFLLTKFSVRTSALAKRWRFLWKHVPNLEFYEDNSDNINRVIMQHEAKTLNTFMLYCVKGSADQLETLIFYPIKCGVRNLYIEFDLRYGGDIVCTVPRLLFTCKTLVDLKFYFCGVIPSSGELFLPSLKKLNLSNVQYESDESLPHLLSGCPVLEELILNDTFRNEQKNQKNSGCVIVSSPTIKTLNVYFCHRHRGEQQLDEMLIIDVPALVYLQVNRCDLDSIKSLRKTMTSLNEVDITLNGDWHMCGIDCNEHGRAIEFLSCLCHVKYLSIKSGYEESLFDIVGNGLMPKFVNLTKLELSLIFDWDRLVKFLEVADNLEVIVFNSGCMPYNEPRLVPTCMLSRLRTVKMYRFIACQDGLDMFKYILKNAKVLEMMEIDPDFLTDDNCDKENYDAFRRISLFERASKSCHLVFGWSIQGIVLSIDSNTLFNF